MKIPIVERCCCFELETGGKIIGWLGIIFGVITSLLLLGIIGFAFSLSCEDIAENEEIKKVIEQFPIMECKILKSGVIIAMIFLLAICLISTYIDILLIRGIQKRDPGKIIPVVVIQAIGTVSSIIRELLAFSFAGVIRAVIVGCFMIYIFIVLYSLYVKIRNEKRTNRDVKFSPLNC